MSTAQQIADMTRRRYAIEQERTPTDLSQPGSTTIIELGRTGLAYVSVPRHSEPHAWASSQKVDVHADGRATPFSVGPDGIVDTAELANRILAPGQDLVVQFSLRGPFHGWRICAHDQGGWRSRTAWSSETLISGTCAGGSARKRS